MPTHYKTTVESHLEELDRYYKELREIAEGRSLTSDDMWPFYKSCLNDDRTIRHQLVSIQADRLTDAIKHFKVSVDGLARLTKKGVSAG